MKLSTVKSSVTLTALRRCSLYFFFFSTIKKEFGIVDETFPPSRSFHGLDTIETKTWQRCYTKGTMLKKKRVKVSSLDKNSQLSIHKTKIDFLKACVYPLKRVFHTFDVIIKKRASYLGSGHENYIFFQEQNLCPYY